MCCVLAIAQSGGSSPACAQTATEVPPSPIELEELTFTFEHPRTVIVYPGEDGVRDAGPADSGRIYWYLRYTLVNKGNNDASFFVSLSAHSDKDRKYRDLALAPVEKKVERIERRPLHSKADMLAEGKPLDAREEYPAGQSRDCVAIFNPLDPEADTIIVEVRGLLNDLVVEKLAGDRVRITERVLRLTFERPGDEFYTALDQFVFKGKKWETVTQELQLPEPLES